MNRFILSLALATLTLNAWSDIESFRMLDRRNLINGTRIPSENYCDQPYVVTATNGEWICVMTTGTGVEGQPGQHIVSCVSTNQGQSWSALTDIEPADGPEASWATPLMTSAGRIYVFFTYNGDKISSLPGDESRIRTDMLGWYCFKYSDDNGRTWSAQRYRVPIPVTACDRNNQWQGAVQVFWGIDKPKVSNGVVYFAFTKLGRYMLEQGEGWIVSSANLLTESDPEKISFKILPEGEESGIKSSVLGSVQEEFNLVPLEQDSMLCVNRTVTGVAAHSYSRDNGVSWSEPVPMTYAPGQRNLKNPRACPKLFKTADGKYLFWYHNHGGTGFKGRNPVFLSGGILAADGFVHWSEPEIVLFDSAPTIRVSYPDLIEQGGEFWITETQKSAARVHKIDRSLLEGMWQQDTAVICREGLLVEKCDLTNGVSQLEIPREFGRLDNGGFSVECWFDVKTMKPGTELFAAIGDDGRGVRLVNRERNGKRSLQIELCDGQRITAWSSEAGVCLENQLQHVVFVCDYSASILSVILNGQYCDGGNMQQYGWGRIPLDASAVNGAAVAELCSDVKLIRLYGRAIRTSEAVANFRAGAE